MVLASQDREAHARGPGAGGGAEHEPLIQCGLLLHAPVGDRRMQTADMSAWRQRRTGRWFLIHRPASLPHCRSTICPVPPPPTWRDPSGGAPNKLCSRYLFSCAGRE